jgi:hypothetical protein
MYCGGGHLGFPIGIKNIKFVEDLPMTIPGKFGSATAGLSLTLNPMGKMFQNASSLKPLGQLKPNCPGMIIGRSSTNNMSLALIIFVVSEKKAFEHFPIGSNVNLCPAVAAILNF